MRKFIYFVATTIALLPQTSGAEDQLNAKNCYNTLNENAAGTIIEEMKLLKCAVYILGYEAGLEVVDVSGTRNGSTTNSGTVSGLKVAYGHLPVSGTQDRRLEDPVAVELSDGWRTKLDNGENDWAKVLDTAQSPERKIIYSQANSEKSAIITVPEGLDVEAWAKQMEAPEGFTKSIEEMARQLPERPGGYTLILEASKR